MNLLADREKFWRKFMTAELPSTQTSLRLVGVFLQRHWCGITISLVAFITLVVVGAAADLSGMTQHTKANSSLRVPCNSNTALVLIAHDRQEYFRQSVASLLQSRGLAEVCILISVDDEQFSKIIEKIVDSEFPELRHRVSQVTHVHPAKARDMSISSDDAITWHYRQIFDTIFVHRKFEYGILLETDLTVSPDFIEYMLQGRDKLTAPGSELFCVSAWNDNGFDHLILREDKLYRTDFFPGLGWMLHRDAWVILLRPQWPSHAGYDWWLRNSSPVRSLDCIAPEVSRTHHISRYGSHVNGEAHRVYDRMLLSSGNVSIPEAEWEVVSSRERFESRILGQLDTTDRIEEDGDVAGVDEVRDDQSIVLVTGASDMRVMLRLLGLYADVLRAGYKGLVSVKQKSDRKQVTVIEAQVYSDFWRPKLQRNK